VAGRVLPWASRHIIYIDPNGRVLHVDRNVSPRTAGAQIAERLAQLGVARRSAPPRATR
jgi:hypothetical protein